MKTKAKAFTLIELMIALAVGAIVILTIVTVFKSNIRLINNEEAKSDLQQDADKIQSLIINIGSQSKRFSYLEASFSNNVLNYTVLQYKGQAEIKNGNVGLHSFSLKLPIGLSIGNYTVNSDEYLEYKFEIGGANGTTLYYSIIKYTPNASNSYDFHTLLDKKELSEYVKSLEVKPVDWEIISTGAAYDAEFISDHLNIARIKISFYNNRKFTNSVYDISAIIKFKNSDF